ncbi:recombination protein NinB [Flavobacterium sp.]|jgi:hypothetical protein|uniref:recombination protein NinB n=1 Tax=Flavobacterium sp. TaxID=239 RepID=UPI0037C01069
MNYEIISEVKNGTLTRNTNLIKDAIQTFEGKQIVIKIEKAKKKRSTPQNSYLWGVVVPIVQNTLKEVGHTLTKDQTHDLLKLKFLKETLIVDESTGETIERIKSTTELSTSQMMDYFAGIREWIFDFFGVTIPEPNQDLTLTLE